MSDPACFSGVDFGCPPSSRLTFPEGSCGQEIAFVGSFIAPAIAVAITTEWTAVESRTSPIISRNQAVASKRSSNRIWRWRAADCHPAQLGEFVQPRAPAKLPVSTIPHPAEGHLRLVVNCRAVDVADAEV